MSVHTGPIKRMSIAEFREEGLLQEVNRLFLHPLGLALEVVINEETGEETLGGIWDYRSDPEGMVFGDVPDPVKADAVEILRQSKVDERLRKFGWTVQPAGLTKKVQG